ncbi:LL-diaminopimelate aminotransferase [Methylacidimicrobium tartarophylax]|uniref:LL-diaminopimelate aminotransferase n=1 Tax=Methylacidimicrobium tartarophylax TaxID=1041768 RepID=A0A5E6MG43_9BACT|nr:LL-diaminopimelate aminotransferase [Methylacidimicrobium tartarophylax]VVM05029.1 LL-diaminopimelate aminotransferase [Methylacidimicrobium tartarophylax]
MENFPATSFAHRIGGPRFGKETEIYKFEKIKRAKRAARDKHPEIELLDLGVGEPDEMAPVEIVERLAEEARKPENRGYADNGGPRLKEAASRYLKRVCGVLADPETEICHSIGSKAALSILPACFINPGDVVLMTVPGYPVFGTHAQYYGGQVFSLPLLEKNSFLPDLESVPADVLRRTKALVLNYPNNPTGATATPAFFEKVVAFAHLHRIIVIHDFAYAGLVFTGSPLSFLSVPGAKEVGLELHSASKNFNMTGWRCGFVAGDARLIRAYASVKDHTDSGQFLAIQHAFAYGLDHPEITQGMAQKYSRRMDLLVEALRRLGCPARKPDASFFLYTPAPIRATTPQGPVLFPTAEKAAEWLITERQISTVPWDEAGAYLRWSVTFRAQGEEEERRVVAELEKRLADTRLQWK